VDAAFERTDSPGDANRDAPLAQDSSDAKRDAAVPDASKPDGAVPYNPCPPKGTPCVILPVGDSITQGATNPAAGGYRAPLFHLALAKMQTITFVGSGADGPAMVDGVAFPRAHEGHSGFNIDNTQGRMGVSQFFPERITTYKPNIVLLMIGTNDIDTGVTDAPIRLGAFMDTILNADPKLLLVVAQIVPQQKMMPDTLNLKVQEYNAAIPGIVKTRVDAGKHVLMVDMYGAFVANPNFSTVLLADKLHPTAAGFGVMADTWYAAIGPLLR
jgi:lysophospholipase L1-like esterase